MGDETCNVLRVKKNCPEENINTAAMPAVILLKSILPVMFAATPRKSWQAADPSASTAPPAGLLNPGTQ